MKAGLVKKSVSAAALLVAALSANADVINFEGDSVGSKPNGFVSGGVTFSSSNASGSLSVYNGLSTECANAANKCLVNFGDDAGYLKMNFGGLMGALSLDFGNDNQGFIPANGLALLRLFLGNTQVGEAFTVVNLNDIMDQSVSYSGASFDNATFQYTDAAKNGVGLIEVVDNIAFTPAQVPEPASLGLLGLGLLGLARSKRRKQ